MEAPILKTHTHCNTDIRRCPIMPGEQSLLLIINFVIIIYENLFVRKFDMEWKCSIAPNMMFETFMFSFYYTNTPLFSQLYCNNKTCVCEITGVCDCELLYSKKVFFYETLILFLMNFFSDFFLQLKTNKTNSTKTYDLCPVAGWKESFFFQSFTFDIKLINHMS